MYDGVEAMPQAQAAFAWLDAAVAKNRPSAILGVDVTPTLYEAGVRGRYRGIEIAVDATMFPENNIRLTFS